MGGVSQSQTGENAEKFHNEVLQAWDPQQIGRREKTPTPKTRFSIWTLLRTPGRFTTRPLPVYFTTKMPVVRPFSVLSNRAPLNGGERNGGYATFVWQARAHTRVTQMTHMPSLKPLCLLCQNQGSLRHWRVICLSQRKTYPPFRSPPFKSGTEKVFQ